MTTLTQEPTAEPWNRGNRGSAVPRDSRGLTFWRRLGRLFPPPRQTKPPAWLFDRTGLALLKARKRSERILQQILPRPLSLQAADNLNTQGYGATMIHEAKAGKHPFITTPPSHSWMCLVVQKAGLFSLRAPSDFDTQSPVRALLKFTKKLRCLDGTLRPGHSITHISGKGWPHGTFRVPQGDAFRASLSVQSSLAVFGTMTMSTRSFL